MILIKQYPSFHIACLYRILYCKSIDDFLHARGIFRSLDYALNATVYAKSGIITIEILFHTETAKKNANTLNDLNIDIDETSIGLGIAQIIAELKKPLHSSNIKEIVRELQKLHHQPWIDIDQLYTIDTRSIEMGPGALTIGEGVTQRTRNLVVDLSLHPKIVASHPELLPLFTRIAAFVHWNCQDVVSNAFGLYSNGVEKVRYANDFGVPLTFKVPPSSKELMNDDDRLRKILWLFINWAHELRDSETVTRFLNDFKHANYKSNRNLMPSPGLILNDTRILVGTKGWKKLATIENCNLLLENMYIQVKYGRIRISLSVGEKR